MYLGDGHISELPRTNRLRIFLDSRDIETIKRCEKSLRLVFPGNKVNVLKRKECNCSVVTVYSKFLLELFPQHGIGEKWQRKIFLHDWQKNLNLKSFVLGLLDSDGCMYIAKQGNYRYPRFYFSNKSDDINDLFHFCLNELNIKFRYFFKEPQRLHAVYVNRKTEVAKILKLYESFDSCEID